MKTQRWLALLLLPLAALVLTSCGTVDVRSTINSAADFQKYHSFNFAPVAQRFDPAVFSVINQVRVKNAIEATLKEKGLKLADNPDLLASYYFSVKDKTYDSRNPSSEGNSVRDTFQKYYGAKYSTLGSMDEQGNLQYNEGTLVIEVIDRRTSQTVYEGIVTGVVRQGQPDQKVEKRIDEAVHAALAKWPR
jgi:hypothetical protein